MNDFLHHLRNQGNKRFDRGRNKPYDGQHRQGDRYGGRDRKGGAARKPAEGDQLGAIRRLLENLLEQHRRLADSTELAALAAERQAGALERIARHLGRDAPEPAPAPDVARPAQDAPAATEGDERPQAAEIILARRGAGDSFERIARLLNTEGIPTLSGKGQWRAQSVSRLFNSVSGGEAHPAD